MKSLNAADRLIIISLALTLGGIIVGALLAEPRLYGLTALFVIGMLIVGRFLTHNQRLAWLLLFGLVAGVLELWSDWLHVEHLGSLVYTDYFGAKLLSSPSYMPVGWWLTCVQFGYLALRLRDRWSPWAVVGVITVLGMSLPPWYEEFAAPARAWYYTPSQLMLSHTPVWVIATYGGCMFSIAVMALLWYRPRAWGRAVVGGIFTSAGFMLSGVFWLTVLG